MLSDRRKRRAFFRRLRQSRIWVLFGLLCTGLLTISLISMLRSAGGGNSRDNAGKGGVGALTLDDNFDPTKEVAWAIPTGGQTKRAKNLDEMLTVLREGGAPSDTIYVFEDDMSRPGGKPDPDVAGNNCFFFLRALMF